MSEPTKRTREEAQGGMHKTGAVVEPPPDDSIGNPEEISKSKSEKNKRNKQKDDKSEDHQKKTKKKKKDKSKKKMKTKKNAAPTDSSIISDRIEENDSHHREKKKKRKKSSKKNKSSSKHASIVSTDDDDRVVPASSTSQMSLSKTSTTNHTTSAANENGVVVAATATDTTKDIALQEQPTTIQSRSTTHLEANSNSRGPSTRIGASTAVLGAAEDTMSTGGYIMKDEVPAASKPVKNSKEVCHNETDATEDPTIVSLAHECKPSVIEEVDEEKGNNASSSMKNDLADAKSSHKVFNSCNDHFRLYAFLAFTIIVVVVIGATVIAVKSTPRQDYSSDTALTGTEAPTTYRDSLGIRAEVESAVGEDVLNDPNSPYSKALDWITYDDPLQLTPDVPNFIQRYIAAYFYFATTKDGPWVSCNPPDDPWSGQTICEFSRLTNTVTNTLQSHSWLSNITECKWAGLECDSHGQARVVHLSGSGLSGTFPQGIYNWPFLEKVLLNMGDLRGPLPTKLAEMPLMTTIELSDNEFTSSIPTSWWRAKKLRKMLLSGNQLTGTISDEIVNLLDMKDLWLDKNKLSGTLPSEIGLLNSLASVFVSHNSINGEIPSTIENWKYVYRINMNNNNFQGTIPNFIGKLKSLEYLHLHNNPNLSGTVPSSLYQLPGLEVLDLSDCNFEGTLSPSIGNLGDSLVQLRISNNKLYGQLPSQLGLLTNLIEVRLHDNDFTGTVPNRFCVENANPWGLEDFTADCAPDDDDGHIELSCDCCTRCCNPEGKDCHPVS